MSSMGCGGRLMDRQGRGRARVDMALGSGTPASLGAGARGFLSKPFALQELSEEVARFLAS